jgi:hypothetical protein
MFLNVLASGAHLADFKKNAAFTQSGEHPIPDARRHIVSLAQHRASCVVGSPAPDDPCYHLLPTPKTRFGFSHKDD